MSKRRGLILPALVLGVLLLAAAIVYLVDPAKSLPSYFPGHDAASSHVHVKHAIAALALAVGALIFAWFQSGPRSASGAQRRG